MLAISELKNTHKKQAVNGLYYGHHWYVNAESYFLIGNALGEGMKKLLMTSGK